MEKLSLEGLTCAEIAKRLGRKPQTVKRHLDSLKSDEKGAETYRAPKAIVDSHRINIRNFIQQYTSSLSGSVFIQRPDPMEEYWHSIEHDKQFPRMLEHCPSIRIKYEVFKTKREDYVRTLYPIYRELVEPLMNAMEGKIGQVIVDDENGAVFRVIEEPAIIADAFVNSYDPCKKDIIGSSDTQKAIEECHNHYQSIISANPNLVACRAKAVQDLETLNRARQDLLDTTVTTLKSSEYLKHRCQWCPDYPS